MFKKRLLAYIIDFFVLSFITFFISTIIPVSESLTNLSNELISVNDSFLSGNIDVSTFVNQYSTISYSIDREMFLTSLISVVASVIYFVIYPLYNNGSSFGKKAMGLSIVSNDGSLVSTNGLIFRYLFMNSIGTSILSLCLIFIVKDFNYVLCVSILSFLQFLVVIISIFMVIYRNDFRSLPDLIAGTKVIEVKK